VRSVLVVVVCLAAGAVALAAPKKKAKAKPKRVAHLSSRFTTPTDAEQLPAVHYGEMSQAECVAELGKRNIAFEKETARGVLAPIRLTGPLHGVKFHSNDSKDSIHEIGDCRLVLAMDDFAAILERHEIVDVRHYSMWRPPPKSWPDDKIGSRHDGALAIDAAHFTTKDGTELDVLKDFHGAIGDKTCGDGAAPHPSTDKAVELRKILCEAVDAHLFNVVLTPDYNKPHRNHFHLEVTAGVKWFLVH
jgi:extensin-like protein